MGLVAAMSALILGLALVAGVLLWTPADPSNPDSDDDSRGDGVAVTAGSSQLDACSMSTTPQTICNQEPVLLIHGWQLDSSANCRTQWSTIVDRLSRPSGPYHFTGPFDTIQYYTDDVGCSTNVLVYGGDREHAGQNHNFNTPIEELALHLNAYIFERYSQHGTAVDVVAHSMGGLVLRTAVVRGDERAAGFHPLLIDDVVTLGTPHDGARLDCLISYECRQMDQDSAFIAALTESGSFPAGEWYLVGSDADAFVPGRSATSLQGGVGSVRYAASERIAHHDLWSMESPTVCCMAYKEPPGGRTLWWAPVNVVEIELAESAG